MLLSGQRLNIISQGSGSLILFVFLIIIIYSMLNECIINNRINCERYNVNN
jgi:hypothetical protein